MPFLQLLHLQSGLIGLRHDAAFCDLDFEVLGINPGMLDDRTELVDYMLLIELLDR